MKTSGVTVHPNQENKSGKAPYASFTEKNNSTNEQRDFEGAAAERGFGLRSFLNFMSRYFNKKSL